MAAVRVQQVALGHRARAGPGTALGLSASHTLARRGHRRGGGVAITHRVAARDRVEKVHITDRPRVAHGHRAAAAALDVKHAGAVGEQRQARAEPGRLSLRAQIAVFPLQHRVEVVDTG